MGLETGAGSRVVSQTVVPETAEIERLIQALEELRVSPLKIEDKGGEEV
jgi:hypothetical protein